MCPFAFNRSCRAPDGSRKHEAAPGSTQRAAKRSHKAPPSPRRLQKILKRNIRIAMRSHDAPKWPKSLRGVHILLGRVSRQHFARRKTQVMNMQNVHAVAARAPFCQNDDCDIENERFLEARAPFLKMCTPSKRERRFGPLQTGKQLMRFLRCCSKMCV